jgi:hypothetical protein
VDLVDRVRDVSNLEDLSKWVADAAASLGSMEDTLKTQAKDAALVARSHAERGEHGAEYLRACSDACNAVQRGVTNLLSESDRARVTLVHTRASCAAEEEREWAEKKTALIEELQNTFIGVTETPEGQDLVARVQKVAPILGHLHEGTSEGADHIVRAVLDTRRFERAVASSMIHIFASIMRSQTERLVRDLKEREAATMFAAVRKGWREMKDTD